MRKVFVETTGFTRWLRKFMDDLSYAEFQRFLMEQPEAGRVIPGCGGLRKIRVADVLRQKGKRGGVRVIYMHVPEADQIFLLDIFGKDERDDLTADQKKTLARLAGELRKQASERAISSGKGGGK